MANFQKHGQNVNGQTIPVPAGKTFELGLWGPIDTRNGNELTVAVSPRNPAVTISRAGMLPGQPVRVLHVSGLPQGRTTLVAQDDGGLVWTTVTLDTSAGASPSTSPGKLYTAHPNEVVTKNTKPSIRQVFDLLSILWAELENNGARTLTAQFGHETGWGRYCFNWNLGNVKSITTANPHMYLCNVWELDTQVETEKKVAASGGLGHIASDEEIRAHGWASQGGKVIGVFQPPHDTCRFRAYGSLGEGSTKWLTYHQALARRNADYLDLLNAGDVAAVAHVLKQAHYYTGPEGAYARNMMATKAAVERELGPLS